MFLGKRNLYWRASKQYSLIERYFTNCTQILLLCSIKSTLMYLFVRLNFVLNVKLNFIHGPKMLSNTLYMLYSYIGMISHTIKCSPQGSKLLFHNDIQVIYFSFLEWSLSHSNICYMYYTICIIFFMIVQRSYQSTSQSG